MALGIAGQEAALQGREREQEWAGTKFMDIREQVPPDPQGPQ